MHKIAQFAPNCYYYEQAQLIRNKTNPRNGLALPIKFFFLPFFSLGFDDGGGGWGV